MGAGILDILEINAGLNAYARPGHWNDPDMLVVGLYGKKGPSGDLGGVGCSDVEYQSQMSLWCLMASPLMISCDVRNMNAATKRILSNKEVIDIDQDPLGKQAERKIKTASFQVFVKPLTNGDIALGVLNTSETELNVPLNLASLGIVGKTQAKDLWNKNVTRTKNELSCKVQPHETRLFRLY